MAKKRPQHQPVKLNSALNASVSASVSILKSAQEKTPIFLEQETQKQEEIYSPSINADKYPSPKTTDIQYKILAFRNDYVKLQDEVVKHLNEGWQLTGGISTCMTVSPYESVTVFAQAIFKN